MEEALLENMTVRALLLMLSTTATFVLLNKTFIQLLPLLFRRYRFVHPERLDSYEFVWKFSNILISLIHSAISGILCLLSVYWYQELKEDIIDSFAIVPYYALAFTLGYFLYDSFDVYIHRNFYERYVEIVMHHTMIILNFGLALIQHRYVGSMIIGLLSEVHNVFLHNRTLYRMAGLSRDSSVYGLICHSNMTTMFLFRTLPYLYITSTFTTISLTGHPYIAWPVLTLFWTSIVLLFIYNCMLFHRLLHTDYIQRQKPLKQMNGALHHPVLASNGHRTKSE